MITTCDAGDTIYDDSLRLTVPTLRLAGYKRILSIRDTDVRLDNG